MSGIYTITNTTTGSVYVGSSRNVAYRWYIHQSELNRGSHHNRNLQDAWHTHEHDAFLFTIVERVEEDDLGRVEAEWMAKLEASGSHLYNAAKIVTRQSYRKSRSRSAMRLSGTKLRTARQRAALSQEDLWRASGVAEATINRLEQDKQRARPSTIRDLADALGVTPDTLMVPDDTQEDHDGDE